MTAGKVAAFVGVVTLAMVVIQSAIPPVAENQSPLQQLWDSWKVQHGKNYATQEEDIHRFSIFQVNYEKIQAHNADSTQTFTMALNKFADLTGDEFRTQYASCSGTGVGDEYCPSAVNCPTLPATNLTNINWTSAGAVTYVKNQQQCGSCWAFSTTGSLEGLYYINKKVLISFSEQQLVDCASSCYGCDGCWPYLAMEYTASNGIEPSKVYPYKGVQGTCQYKKAVALAVNTGYQCVTQQSVSQMEAALAQQPVSIAVEADQDSWQFYASGILSSGCGDTLDHAVLLVGMDTTQNAWWVKNSWGTDWGEAGYIWLSQDATQNGGYGVCGILRCGTLPINS